MTKITDKELRDMVKKHHEAIVNDHIMSSPLADFVKEHVIVCTIPRDEE